MTESKRKSKKKTKPANPTYEVEKILADKFEDGVQLFYIKWVGYDHAENTWEPYHCLNCPDLLLQYEKDKITKKRPSATPGFIVKKKQPKLKLNPKINGILPEVIRRFTPGTPFQEEWTKLLQNARMNIQVTNTVDNCPPPQNFTWSDDYILHGKVPCIDLDFTTGCECETDCADSCNDCICIAAQEGEHAYDQNECVRFAPTTMAIYECNLKCACNILCQNRVTQRGPRLTFEIYRTPNGKGWGVRTLNALKKGQFVSKYIGEIITTAEAVNRNSRMSYMFDLDFFGYESSKYVIDAYDHGNISRLYNHSCEPNMATYSVFVDTHDPSRHELAFFTTRAIEPNEELTFDYRGFRSKSQKKDVGAGKDRPGFQCYCGTKSCQGIIPLFHTDK